MQNTNKSQVVRDAFEKFGLEATASQVREYAKTQGFSEELQSGLISNIRASLRNNGKKTKTAKAATETAAQSITIETLVSARELITRCGGVTNAQALLSVLS